MTDQVFPDLPQTPPPEPPADASAQEESSEALTPAQEIADVSDSPFCRAIGLIAGGLAVTGVTLNFWNLDVLLPLVGTFCLLVGFRALRRVNGFLRAGYVCACLHMLLFLLSLGRTPPSSARLPRQTWYPLRWPSAPPPCSSCCSSASGRGCSICSATQA